MRVSPCSSSNHVPRLSACLIQFLCLAGLVPRLSGMFPVYTPVPRLSDPALALLILSFVCDPVLRLSDPVLHLSDPIHCLSNPVDVWFHVCPALLLICLILYIISLILFLA